MEDIVRRKRQENLVRLHFSAVQELRKNGINVLKQAKRTENLLQNLRTL